MLLYVLPKWMERSESILRTSDLSKILSENGRQFFAERGHTETGSTGLDVGG